MVELHETLVQAEALRARTSNKDGIPGIPQDVASLQQRAASVALGGAEGVGVGDHALAKARAFLPSEQLEGMSRLAYSLELRSAFQPPEGPLDAGGMGMGAMPPAPEGAEDLDTFLDRHYQSVVASALDAAADAAEAAAHRAQLRWEAEDWETAKADLRKAREATPGMQLLELSLAQQEQPEMLAAGGVGNVHPALALRIARGTSRLSDVQKRYARALAPSAGAAGAGAEDTMDQGGPGPGGEEEEDGLAQRLLTAARGISRASRETVVAEDHEEFRRTLELLGELLEEERGERHVPALPPHSARDDWSRVLVFRARRHLERDFYDHMRRKVERARLEGRVVVEVQGPLGVAAAFVDLVRASPLGTSEDDRPYEIVFHLLRGGQLQEAAQYAAAQSSAGGGPVSREVVEVLEDLAASRGGGEAAPELHESIRSARALAGRREGAAEVWERAVLNLVGYGAVGRMDKANAVRTTEDYLWWSLWFCAPTNPANTSSAFSGSSSSTASGRFTVQELAAKVLRWGEAHFDRDGSKRFLYARVLFACQLFREGVAHLAKSKHLEAVHLALVLSDYDLLADLPSALSQQQPSGPVAAPSAAAVLEALVVAYIRDFKGTDPQVAADYLLRLRPPERLERGLEALLVELEDQGSRKALAEYLKAKYYAFDYRPAEPAAAARLSTRGGGSRGAAATAGAGTGAVIKRYVWDAAQAKATLRRAGAQAEALDARRALELHELGEDYTRALALLNRQLCLVVVPPSAEREGWVGAMERFVAQGLLENVPETWEGQALKATFGKLRALRRFFDLCEQGGPWTEQALKIVFEDLRLFPSKVQERSAAKEAFEAAPPEFKRVVGQAAAMTMQALYNEWRGKRRGAGGGGGAPDGPWAGAAAASSGYAVAAAAGTDAKLAEIKEKAQALADFAMSVGPELSNDTLARLNRLQSMMI